MVMNVVVNMNIILVMIMVENNDDNGDEHDRWGRDSSCSSDWLVAPLGDVLHLEVIIIDHWITEEYKQGISEYF